jgi:hypothetical protein
MSETYIAPEDRHPDVRKAHADGSPVNVCRSCKHFTETHPDVRGQCARWNIKNMWFGNCDAWWPAEKVM